MRINFNRMSRLAGLSTGTNRNSLNEGAGMHYEVDDDTMKRLDRLEGYSGKSETNFYDRTTVSTPHGDAYMYTLENYRYADSDMVESGNWKGYKLKLKDLL